MPRHAAPGTAFRCAIVGDIRATRFLIPRDMEFDEHYSPNYTAGHIMFRDGILPQPYTILFFPLFYFCNSKLSSQRYEVICARFGRFFCTKKTCDVETIADWNCVMLCMRAVLIIMLRHEEFKKLEIGTQARGTRQESEANQDRR